MKAEAFTYPDLKRISGLQPDDWSDIIPFFSYYLKADYCDPIKVETDNKVVGIGTSIKYRHTAWIAHIIVHPGYRCRGIGTYITNTLVDRLMKQKYRTVFLIATKLGEPVYRKLGFEKETEYLFFKDGKYPADIDPPEELLPYSESYKADFLDLDEKASGEKREAVLSEHFTDSVLYVRENKVSGFYMPSLGEGLIVAENEPAGLELMKMKYSTVSKAILPMENKAGIEFLIKIKFKEYSKGIRMRFGEKIQWHPEMLYSRIGGNLG
ncbi:MAG: GNAT family N-acetyltransferase [Bacteroidales bacterium]|nr:GNAT family N-acetyltransferase [Bacteroidales bacterium]